MLRPLLGCTLLAVFIACGGQEVTTPSGSSGPSRPSGPSGPKLADVVNVAEHRIDKVDILFVVDNSPSMGSAQTLLSLAVPIMVDRLVQPDCVDPNTARLVGVSQNGSCPSGSRLEFPPVHDLHLGILTSSLGGMGSDACPEDATNPAAPSLSAHMNDRGELVNRAGAQGMPTVENPMPDESPPDDFLAYFPGCSNSGTGQQCLGGANAGKTIPANAITYDTNLISDFQSALLGVHEHGCSFAGQNEAWYRFLVQPDPYATIARNGSSASLQGIDETILKQRADFLRPDSLLVVAVVTNQDEAIADPMAIGGQGWAFENSVFPGSPNGAAPEASIECSQLDPNNPATTGPNDPRCTSCAFIHNDPNFAARCPDDPPTGSGGYLDPRDDALAVRFFHQKQRFGISAAYPVSRYVTGLQNAAVPDRQHEHDGNSNYVGDQAAQQNCVNPLYAQSLPKSATMDLCHLQPGPRTPDLVYYAAIAGVPHELLQATPGEMDPYGACPPTTPAAQCPQKDVLSDADWTRMLGKDPEHYDFSGADFHMIASTQDRTASSTDPSSPAWANHSTCPDSSSDTCDPINGRERATGGAELQFSCIFPLITVDSSQTIQAFQKDCTTPGPGDAYKGACDCAPGSPDADSPLCQGQNGTHSTLQINAKAYPPVRELLIAKAMSKSAVGDQGIVSSICPISLDVGGSVAQAQQDPLFGFNPAMNAIIDRLRVSLSGACVPIDLPRSAADAGTPGLLTCTMFVQLLSAPSGTCKDPGAACSQSGLVGPGVVLPGQSAPVMPHSLLSTFCDELEARYHADAGQQGVARDPAGIPVCAMPQVVLDPNDATDCSQSGVEAWCYVQGPAAQARGCSSLVAFGASDPPNDTMSYLECTTP